MLGLLHVHVVELVLHHAVFYITFLRGGSATRNEEKIEDWCERLAILERVTARESERVQGSSESAQSSGSDRSDSRYERSKAFESNTN